MTSVPAGIAAEQAINRQNIALSVVRAAADADQQIAQILDQSLRSAPVSESRGTNINIRA